MKTIVIFYSYYAPHVGGLEKYTYNLCKSLTEKGNKVILITAQFQKDLPLKENAKEATIYRFPVWKDLGTRYPVYKKSSLKNIFSILDNTKIDLAIIQARFYFLSLHAAKHTESHNIPTICVDHGCDHLTVHNKLLDSLGAFYEHGLTYFLKKHVQHFYAVSKASLNWLKHFHIIGEGVLYNSVDANNIAEQQKYVKKSKEQVVISFAGRMLDDKGVLELVQAFKLLNKNYNNLVLYVIGDGPMMNIIKEEVDGISNIKLAGKLPNEDVMKILGKSHIFVNPSRSEGMPTCILEAGSMKCAVVATPVGGTTEIIPDENYGLFCEKDVNSVERRISELLDDKDKMHTLGENLYKRVLSTFTWDKVADKVLKIADNLK